MASSGRGGLVYRYVDHLNELFNRTISSGRLVALGTEFESEVYHVTCFQTNKRLPLRVAPGYLHFRQTVEDQGDNLELLTYLYMYTPTEDPDIWFFRYEYDRGPKDANQPQAHFHVNADLVEKGRRKLQLAKIHFPSSVISAEHIIALLVFECGVTSLANTDDTWRILRESFDDRLSEFFDSPDWSFP